MAKDNYLSKLVRELSKGIKKAPLKPSWHYNEEGDYIESFWEETPYYAKRINNAITLYIDRVTARVNGIMLKNVKYGLKGEDTNSQQRGD